MSRLTAEQIAQHAYRAGFRGADLATVTAIALAESGGNTRAHNGVPPDNSYGLWQVNMLGALGPERRHEFHLHSNDELFDPDQNAKAAWAISGHGNSFQPWSTYTDGAYRKYLDEARKAATHVSAHHGKTEPVHHHPTKGHGGYKVDVEQLHAYTRKIDHVVAELRHVGTRTVHTVTGIAKDSFGKVGAETGFAGALGDFSRSLEKQVKTTADNARALGAITTKAASAYQGHEESASAGIKSVLG